MSPRSRTPRKISKPPKIKGFKAYGGELGEQKQSAINLLLEEYEAIRLCDYDHLNHQEAAELMGVSRPTFTRIYASALEKIAHSFVLGRGIIIEGGHIYFDSNWCYCKDCESKFSNPSKRDEKITCPLCGSLEVSSVKESGSNEKKVVFRCHQCGVKKEVSASEAKSEQLCQICKIPMTPELETNCGLKECL